MRCNLGSDWDRPELGYQGNTPTGEFRVFDIFVPEREDEPQAYLVRSHSEHAEVGTHFHEHPQFQVFVEGDGVFRRHAVAPYAVHFTDAYSVYGPIVAGDDGLSFFVLRPQLGQGAHYMPGSRDTLVRRGRRNLSVPVDPDALSNVGTVTVFADDDGLVAETVVVGAHDSVTLRSVPDSSPGSYTLVLRGSCAIEGSGAAGTYTVVHRTSKDGSSVLAAGEDGVALLTMQFPHAHEEDR